MSIILRTLKGSALTYEEMDRNLSQYFYSSSVHDSGTELRLHFTGSDSLDTVTEDYGPDRYHSITIGAGGASGVTKIIAGTNVTISPVSGIGEVTINSTGGGAGSTPGGSDGSIQFNNSSVFGGDSKLFYNDTNYLVGISTNSPSNRLHILGDSKSSATLRLESATTGTTKFAQTLLYNGTTKIGAYGKVYSAETDSYLSTYSSNKLHIEYNSKKTATFDGAGLGIFTTTPNRPLTVKGSIGIQSDLTTNHQSIIQPIPAGIYASNVLKSGASQYGVMISPPLTTINGAGGHVVVSISEPSAGAPSVNNSFSIVSSTNEGYSSALPVACFRSNAVVGIGTNDPQVALDVVGQIRGTYTDLADDTTALGLAFSKVVKVKLTGHITFTSSIGKAGTEATVIIEGPGGARTVTFNPTYFVVQGNLSVSNNFYTVSFVSDGTKWYETSRTSALN